MPTQQKSCKDCAPDSKRPAPHPGPRCVTHHRAVRKTRKASAHDLYVQRNYGLEPGEYDDLYEAQDGKCYTCRRANGATRKLSVDHDHSCCPKPPTCGRCNRGLLCRPCNDMFGHARDDIQFFVRAIQYLSSPPYDRLKDT